jgi:hypothetical protein
VVGGTRFEEGREGKSKKKYVVFNDSWKSSSLDRSVLDMKFFSEYETLLSRNDNARSPTIPFLSFPFLCFPSLSRIVK